MNYYDLLQVNFHATFSQITKAYRKLALKYHPDKAPNNDCALQKFLVSLMYYCYAVYFKDIKKAYDTLSSHTLRERYNRKLFRLKAQKTKHVSYHFPFPRTSITKDWDERDFEIQRIVDSRRSNLGLYYLVLFFLFECQNEALLG